MKVPSVKDVFKKLNIKAETDREQVEVLLLLLLSVVVGGAISIVLPVAGGLVFFGIVFLKFVQAAAQTSETSKREQAQTRAFVTIALLVLGFSVFMGSRYWWCFDFLAWMGSLLSLTALIFILVEKPMRPWAEKLVTSLFEATKSIRDL